MSDEVQPTVVRGIPYCAKEKCSSYDGKRCRVMGFQPHAICEPAVDEMQSERDTLKAKLETARAEALEEAAKVAEQPLPCGCNFAPCEHDDVRKTIASRIRALTGTTTRGGEAACPHPSFDESGRCHACLAVVASAVPCGFARTMAAIERGVPPRDPETK